MPDRRATYVLGFLLAVVTVTASMLVIGTAVAAEPDPEPEVCEWDSELLADDPDCVEPVPCPYDETLWSGDPECVEPEPEVLETPSSYVVGDDPLAVLDPFDWTDVPVVYVHDPEVVAAIDALRRTLLVGSAVLTFLGGAHFASRWYR